jgi:hypothetical protein
MTASSISVRCSIKAEAVTATIFTSLPPGNLRICRVPTNANQDYVYRKAHSFGIEHIELRLLLKGA